MTLIGYARVSRRSQDAEAQIVVRQTQATDPKTLRQKPRDCDGNLWKHISRGTLHWGHVSDPAKVGCGKPKSTDPRHRTHLLVSGNPEEMEPKCGLFPFS